MDYRIIAVEELKGLKHNYTAEKTIKLRILELDTLLKSSGGSGGGISSSGGGNKTEQKWLSLISNLDDEKERLESVVRKIKRVELALSALSDEEEQLLRMAYIEQKKVDEIAEMEHMSRATVFRHISTALINFTRALYGAVVT